MRKILVVLLIICLLIATRPLATHAARLFNGTSDAMQAPGIDLSGVNKLAISMWLYWDTFANDDDLALEFTANGSSTAGGFTINPNHSTSTAFDVLLNGNVGISQAHFTRPSATAWHQYVFNLDMSAGSGSEIASVYMDGASQSLTNGTVSNNTGNFASSTLNFMSRNDTTLFGAGRICEVAIYPDTLLTAAEAGSLASGYSPLMVHPSARPFYWPIIGANAVGTTVQTFEAGTVPSPSSGTISNVTSPVYTGGHSLRCNATTTGAGWSQALSFTATATADYRFFFRYATKPSSTNEDIAWAATAAQQRKLVAAINSSGNLVALDRSRNLLATGSTVLSADTWYMIGMHCETGNSVSWSMKINNAAEISGSSADLFTTNNGALLLGKVLDSHGNTVDFFYDDAAVTAAGTIPAWLDPELFYGRLLTPIGTTQTAHPRIIYPSDGQ